MHLFRKFEIKMKRKIITNLKELRKTSEKITNFTEIQDIIIDLEDTLKETSGIGLSAIQIGIPKAVSIIRYQNKKINLVNSGIIDKFGKFCMRDEGCLSLSGIRIDTIRCKEITIENEGKQYTFDIENDGIICIAIQHEIDHFKGILILNRKWKNINRSKK